MQYNLRYSQNHPSPVEQCLRIHTVTWSPRGFSSNIRDIKPSSRSTSNTCVFLFLPNSTSRQDAAGALETKRRSHLAWADLRLQRCRSCPACSESAPPPRPMTPAMTTARRASGAESGCTAASGSGHSCSCREQQHQRDAAKRKM